MPTICRDNNFRHCPRKQHGAALMVMLVIMVMGTAAFLVSSLSKSALSTVRQETTSAALAQAKEALIGYAASDDNRPGELPCPDTDNDGSAEMLSGTNCSGGNFGRLPWKTLGLPDLRDAAGERLWYAVSDPFHAGATAQLNSDTAGTLTVSGNISANNVIAIVFAPGQNLPGQDRSAANINTSSAYLESVVTAPTSFNLLTPDDQPGGNHTYNDQLRLITHDDLLPSMEKVAGNEVKKILNTYYAAWGAYPFAASFADPSTSSFTGAIGTYNGLLPIGNNTLPTWGAAPTISFNGSITGGPMECILSNDIGGGNFSRWRCCKLSTPTSCSSSDIIIPAGVTVTITGTLNNVGLGLWRPHHIDNVCEVRARNSSGSIQATSILDNVSVTGSLNSNGSATVVFRATGKPGGTTLRRIELRDISSYNTDIKTYSDSSNCSSPSSSSPVIPKWLFNNATEGNNWHQFAYYAVSPGHTQSSSACTPLPGTPPSCLTVNGSSGGNDKRAAVVMTGNALIGQSRAASPNALCPATGTTIAPNECLSNYLELENATPADFIYENKIRSSTFNDQVIVVAP